MIASLTVPAAFTLYG